MQCGGLRQSVHGLVLTVTPEIRFAGRRCRKPLGEGKVRAVRRIYEKQRAMFAAHIRDRRKIRRKAIHIRRCNEYRGRTSAAQLPFDKRRVRQARRTERIIKRRCKKLRPNAGKDRAADHTAMAIAADKQSLRPIQRKQHCLDCRRRTADGKERMLCAICLAILVRRTRKDAPRGMQIVHAAEFRNVPAGKLFAKKAVETASLMPGHMKTRTVALRVIPEHLRERIQDRRALFHCASRRSFIASLMLTSIVRSWPPTR